MAHSEEVANRDLRRLVFGPRNPSDAANNGTSSPSRADDMLPRSYTPWPGQIKSEPIDEDGINIRQPQAVPQNIPDMFQATPEHREIKLNNEVVIESRQSEEVLKNIQHIYETGTPFFTKAVMQDIVKQFEALDGRAGEVIITDLAGTVMSTRVAADADKAPFKRLPVIRYAPINHLYLNARYPTHFDKKAAYLPISLSSTRYALPAPEYGKFTSKDFHKDIMADRWDAPFPVAKRLGKILDSTTVPPIHKIVGLACSRMEMFQDAYTMRQQCSLLLVLRDLLVERGHSSPMACYIQDSALTDYQERALGQEWIFVLDDPKAFLEVDETTAVVALSPIQPVRQIIADIARPAMMIWPRGDKRIMDLKKYRPDV